MKIITVSDIHGETSMINRIGEVLASADLVLISGDITNFGGREEARKVIDEFLDYNSSILAVPGNCDHPEVETYLENEGLSLHRGSRLFENFGIAGVGGSLITPFFTPYEFTDRDMEAYLYEGVAGIPPGTPLVLLLHHPPHETKLDFASASGHLGSSAVRRFIMEKHPLVCFSGHIHEAVGIDSIGETKLANPGPLRNGKYVYTEIGNGLKLMEIREVS